MARFQVRCETRMTHNNLAGNFFVLVDNDTGACAEIWPALGFNCIRWKTCMNEKPVDWLYSAPDLLHDTRPTRSGFPVLFPFPNRIRDGRFWWAGRFYQLPMNDPAGKNAIHGFACRHNWRIVGQGADNAQAWITGEFWASADAADVIPLWPADHRIQVTYRLKLDSLQIDATIENPDDKPLPFGLGFHPYFKVTDSPGQTLIHVPARRIWELEDNLPTGRLLNVDDRVNLSSFRRFSDLRLDDVLTELTSSAGTERLRCWGVIENAEVEASLQLLASPVFREIVVFTPPHRRAICIEPYTCTTDAVNLQQQQVDAGWRVLSPGKLWSAQILLRISETSKAPT